MTYPTLCRVKRPMDKFPSQIWYLILASDVSPINGKIEDPLETGKKRNATHMFPR